MNATCSKTNCYHSDRSFPNTHMHGPKPSRPQQPAMLAAASLPALSSTSSARTLAPQNVSTRFQPCIGPISECCAPGYRIRKRIPNQRPAGAMHCVKGERYEVSRVALLPAKFENARCIGLVALTTLRQSAAPAISDRKNMARAVKHEKIMHDARLLSIRESS